jgi:hypothetical protein
MLKHTGAAYLAGQAMQGTMVGKRKVPSKLAAVQGMVYLTCQEHKIRNHQPLIIASNTYTHKVDAFLRHKTSLHRLLDL